MSIQSAPATATTTQLPIPRWLSALLIIAAFGHVMLSLTSLPVLFGDWNEAPGPGLGGKITLLKIALEPVLGLLAAYFLIAAKLRSAVFMFAAIYALTWASFLPSVIGQADDAKPDAFFRAQMIFELYLAPVIALAIAAIAIANSHLLTASLLALAPAVFHFVSFLIFSSALLIHGF